MRIMLVDDDANGLKALKRALSSCFKDAVIDAFTSSRTACNKLRQSAYDIIISDFRMPEVDGVAFLSRAKQIQPCCIRFMLSGYCQKDSLYDAINIANVHRFIEKPYDAAELAQAIKNALSDKVEMAGVSRLL